MTIARIHLLNGLRKINDGVKAMFDDAADIITVAYDVL